MKSLRKRIEKSEEFEDSTEIIKEIKLTVKQQDLLHADSDRSEYFKKSIKAIITSLVDESYECDRLFWDGIAKLCGYKNTREASAKGQGGFRVNWLKGVIEVRKRKEGEC